MPPHTDDADATDAEATGIREVLTGGSGWFLLVLAFGWFLTLGSRFLVPALLPAIKAEFAVENAGAGLIVTVIWLTYGGMQFPAGVLTDRVGERVLLGASTLLAAVSMLGFALAPTYEWFLVAGAGFGIATGLFGPARGTALTKQYDEFEGLAFGTVLGAGSVGAAMLPLVATVITDAFGWRMAIGVVGPAFFLAGVGLLVVVPKSLPGGSTPGSLGEGVRQSIGALGTRRVGVAVAGIVLMLFVFQGLTAFYPTYLVAEGTLPQSTASALYALLFLTGGAFQLSAGRLADRFGYRRVLVAVSAVSVLPLVALPYVRSLWLFAVVTVFIAVRLALGPMTNAYIIGSLPTENKGTMWGFIRTGFFVIGAFGSTVVGGFADLGYFDAAIYGLAALTVVGGLLYFRLPKERV